MNQANWAKIHSTKEAYKAEIIKDVLSQKEIQCVVVDKKDTAYGAFGELELYVQRENVIMAKHILAKKELDI